MPVSNSGVRVINPVLSNVAQGYTNMQFVGGALFPRVPVNTRGGQIIEFGKEAFMRYATRRAPGGAAARIQFGYAGKPFALSNDAADMPVPREHQQDASVVPGIDLGRRAINVGMRVLAMGLEIDQALMATNAANYAASNKVTLAGAGKWSAATGTPLTDIDAGREAIRQQCGIYPNTLVLSALGFSAAKNNPNVISRFQYDGVSSPVSAQITAQMLAGLFNVEKVVIGGAIYFNDAGVSTDVWGNNAVLAYVPSQPSALEEPSYGYTYTYEGHPLVEEPYWDASARSWVYGCTYERAPVLSGIACGYLIQNPA
ncbi:MAG: major capsid protein [Proteobacteria bacterium]|nr:major capsid protein [Pseudomonadota bacterium]